jgi:hypothetical protein
MANESEAGAPPQTPEPCPYCGCTGSESVYQRARLINSAAILAAHAALGDPARGVSALAELARGAAEPGHSPEEKP